MRSLAAVAMAAALLSSCAHTRVPAYAGEDRQVVSGVPAHFAGPGELPEGTKVLWDFGDGTPAVEGASADHAFPRAGAFTVTQTVQDKDGEKRTSTARATVLRRTVPMAVPADARAALIAQWPWARVKLQREVAARLGLRDFYDQIAASLSRAVGFEVTDPQQTAEHGIDPDEGFAIFTVRDDVEALVVAVGVSDEAKAEEAVRRVLERDLSEMSPELKPFTLKEGKLPSGARAVIGTRAGGADLVAYTFKYGYLYLRTPAATDPLVALKGVDALAPDKGLERDPGYLAAVRRVGPGDFVFYSTPAPPQGWGGPGPAAGQGAANERTGPLARTAASQLGASAFSVGVKPDRLDVRIFAQLRNLTGEKLVAAFTPTKPPPDLASKLPAGAIAYVKLSGSPQALWTELGRAAGERKQEMEERLHAMTGLDIEKEWLPLFTGNAGLAFYLDAQALLDAVLGEQVASFDRSTLLVAAEIADGKADAVRAALEKGAKELSAKLQVEALEVEGTKVFRLGEGAILAAQKGDVLLIALGGPREAESPSRHAAEHGAANDDSEHADEQKREPSGPQLGPLGPALRGARRTLSDVLKRAGVRGFDLPHDQLLYVDIAAAVRQLQRAAEVQGGAVGLGAHLMAERVSGLRDALLEVRPSTEGLDAELTLRFAQPRASGGAK